MVAVVALVAGFVESAARQAADLARTKMTSYF
jgi:hypothetical protein